MVGCTCESKIWSKKRKKLSLDTIPRLLMGPKVPDSPISWKQPSAGCKVVLESTHILSRSSRPCQCASDNSCCWNWCWESSGDERQSTKQRQPAILKAFPNCFWARERLQKVKVRNFWNSKRAFKHQQLSSHLFQPYCECVKCFHIVADRWAKNW